MSLDPFKIGDYVIEYPFTISSGIGTTTAPTTSLLLERIKQLGFATSKSLGIERREGNQPPILVQIADGTYLNAVGLSNPGYEEFAEELRETHIPKGKYLMQSFFGKDREEFVTIARGLARYADFFELNCSCPHVEGFGRDMPRYIETVRGATRGVKNIGKPTFVKLAPTENISEMAMVAVEAGADGLVAINTEGPYENPILTNRKGGRSGRGIRDIGLECVRKIRAVTDVPLVVTGGISTADDVRMYQDAARKNVAFGIGSVCGGMSTDQLVYYFNALESDLEHGTNYTAELLVDWTMRRTPYKIRKIQQVADDLKVFYFDGDLESEPGQFVFTQIPEHEEKPFSIADDSPFTIAVRRINNPERPNNFTSRLFEAGVGDEIYVRGPYGRGFELYDNSVLVGGGTGAAPLNFLAKRMDNPLVFLGGKTRDQLLFLNDSVKPGDVIATTEDGSYGTKGLVTDALMSAGKSGLLNGATFYNCGPEGMMVAAAELEKEYTHPSRIQVAVERYMKCGVGICDSCEINGYRSCVDGPVFYLQEVDNALGVYSRDMSGARIEL
ncbi:MAG: dihydroorotate dehydrogenase [Candidatus Aenigmatarchaeota archaeon]